MGRLGIIARCDEGGLGTQTQEYVRHLRPHRALVIRVPPCRGTEDIGRLKSALLTTVVDSHWDWEHPGWLELARRCDVVLAAETAYNPRFHEMCRHYKTKLVIHANPELWDGSEACDEVWAPTDWMLHRLPPGTPVVPVPVDRQRCSKVQPGNVDERSLLVLSSPAMLDRNGATSVLDALRYCTEPWRVGVAGPEAPVRKFRVGKSTVEPVDPKRNYWELYAGWGALVIPRRYGGLCLPMQEAASRGLPVVTTNLAPQSRWFPAEQLVGATNPRPARMKGGKFSVYSCRAKELAAAIDSLADPSTRAAARSASEAFASGLDWRNWEREYKERLGCAS